MPIFEYLCPECGKRFEKIVLGGAGDSVRCPRCRSTGPEKLFSRFAAVGGRKSTDDEAGGPGGPGPGGDDDGFEDGMAEREDEGPGGGFGGPWGDEGEGPDGDPGDEDDEDSH
jgi:putative FmdB family regulatory protein